ncbi:MAG: hypothetical protein ABEI13_04365 [Candidatus Paceibacteria bacterium]
MMKKIVYKVIEAIKNPIKVWELLVYRTLNLEGNLLGTQVYIRNHIKGRINIIIKRHKSEVNRYGSDLYEKLKREGYELVENESTSYPRSKYKNSVYSRAILKVHERIPELSGLLTDDVISALRAYYGSYVGVKHIYYWRNYHVPDNILNTEVFSDRWHPDREPIDITKLFVNISDVTTEHGPFHILPLQQSRKLSRQNRRRLRPEEFGEFVDSDDIVKAVGSAGTAMLCNTELCWHRAGIPEEGNYRDIIQFQFKPSSKPLGNDWLNKVELKNIEKKYIDNM